MAYGLKALTTPPQNRNLCTILKQEKNQPAQCQDNVTESEIRAWCWRPGLPVGHIYIVLYMVYASINQAPISSSLHGSNTGGAVQIVVSDSAYLGY